MTTTRRTLLAGSATLPFLGHAALAQPRTITVGYQLPLTGEFSQYGERFRNSALMALEAFNTSRRIPAQVNIVFEDTRSDPREAVAVARKFVDNREIVAVLGDFSSSASIQAGRVYAEAGMPQLSQTASHPDFVKVSPWQFRNITTQAYEGPHVARWMSASGVKRVAVVAIQNDWGQSVVSNFVDAFKATGGEVVATQMYNPGNREFRAILTDIARTRPDAIYLGMFYEDGASFLQQRRQLNIRAAVYGTSSMYEPKLIELAGPGSEGMFLSTSFMAESPEAHVKAYVEEYTRRFRSEPNMFSAQAFDAVNIMLEAIARAWPDVTRQRVRDELAKTKDFPGVTGATTFDPETREPAKTLARMRIQDGKFTLLPN
ncbi:ABC transporter substrate-binding protein [Elioraea sp.]|uniref:ABC transporter substrate-binding protein n=1 Tax=Elioraea sp. TaxID=2185103 RepID=UPI0025BDC1AC|nr:ABC transporter substrate-binding protein [Elioraea sp.]